MTIGETFKDVRNAGKKLIIILIFLQKVMVTSALSWLQLFGNLINIENILGWSTEERSSKNVRLLGTYFIENILPSPISSSFIQTKLEKNNNWVTINMNNGKNWKISETVKKNHDTYFLTKDYCYKYIGLITTIPKHDIQNRKLITFDCLGWPNLEEITWVEKKLRIWLLAEQLVRKGFCHTLSM